MKRENLAVAFQRDATKFALACATAPKDSIIIMDEGSEPIVIPKKQGRGSD